MGAAGRLGVGGPGRRIQSQPQPCSPPAVALICLLRYGQLLEQNRHSWVNTTALITGCTNAAGLVVVGNFQVPSCPPHLNLEPPPHPPHRAWLPAGVVAAIAPKSWGLRKAMGRERGK